LINDAALALPAFTFIIVLSLFFKERFIIPPLSIILTKAVTAPILKPITILA